MVIFQNLSVLTLKFKTIQSLLSIGKSFWRKKFCNIYSNLVLLVHLLPKYVHSYEKVLKNYMTLITTKGNSDKGIISHFIHY